MNRNEKIKTRKGGTYDQLKISSPLFFGERGLRIKSKKQETNF